MQQYNKNIKILLKTINNAKKDAPSQSEEESNDKENMQLKNKVSLESTSETKQKIN